MFFAVELESDDVSQNSPVGGLHETRTSLTGIEETPTSIAMNQHALVRELATTTKSRQDPSAKNITENRDPFQAHFLGRDNHRGI